jgi:ABC-2 type transport system ATP-binding protein
MQEVEAVCERVLILHNGQLALDRQLDELRSCGDLILRTDNSVPDLESHLRRLPQIAAVDLLEQVGQTRGYCLHLHQGTEPDTAAGNISHCVQGLGGRLYRLEPQEKHLDDIFREVTGGL